MADQVDKALHVGAYEGVEGKAPGNGVITLDGEALLAPEVTETVLKEALEASLVGQVATARPIPLAGQAVPIYNGGVEVGLVGEGAAKPTSAADFAVKHLHTAKVATIVVVSRETAKANPLRMMELVQADMVAGIARAADSLVLHKRDPRGVAYTGPNASVIDTPNVVELGEGAALDEVLLAAYDAAAEAGDPNGWLFDTRLRGRLTRAVQDVQEGLPNLRGGAAVVAGLPAHYGRIVTGRTTMAAETGVRGIVGDWTQVRWGYVERLEITRSTEATVQGVSMFETNQVALLVEAVLGWQVLDPAAFTVIRNAA